MFATALEINANHFQMTYYYFFIDIGYFIYCNIKDKTYKPLLNSLAVLAIAGIFAIGAKTNLLATAEYGFSTRGKAS
jgi:hypothetical protein